VSRSSSDELFVEDDAPGFIEGRRRSSSLDAGALVEAAGVEVAGLDGEVEAAAFVEAIMGTAGAELPVAGAGLDWASIPAESFSLTTGGVSLAPYAEMARQTQLEVSHSLAFIHRVFFRTDPARVKTNRTI
jgi:hypothetical protein